MPTNATEPKVSQKRHEDCSQETNAETKIPPRTALLKALAGDANQGLTNEQLVTTLDALREGPSKRHEFVVKGTTIADISQWILDGVGMLNEMDLAETERVRLRYHWPMT